MEYRLTFQINNTKGTSHDNDGNPISLFRLDYQGIGFNIDFIVQNKEKWRNFINALKSESPSYIRINRPTLKSIKNVVESVNQEVNNKIVADLFYDIRIRNQKVHFESSLYGNQEFSIMDFSLPIQNCIQAFEECYSHYFGND